MEEERQDSYVEIKEEAKEDKELREVKKRDEKGKEIKEKTSSINNVFNKFSFVSKKVKSFSLTLSLLCLFFIALLGSWLRTRNLALLKDATTGKYLPLALDPFYFLRLAELLLTRGNYPAFDAMRYPAAKVGFTKEILPQVEVFLYKVLHFFNSNITINYVAIIYPVIFFIFGLVVYFFLAKTLTKSNLVAIVSSLFLAIIPTYLYRTLAGFADHEAIGMFALFLTFLTFYLTFDKTTYEKIKNEKLKRYMPYCLAILTALFAFFTFLSWGGAFNFIPLILPFTLLLYFILGKVERREIILYFVFYIILFFFIFIFNITKLLSANSLPLHFVFATFIIHLIFFETKLKKKTEKIKHKELLSIVLAGVVGLIFVLAINPALLSNLIEHFFYPFGRGRVSLTVAENQQPYFRQWIANTGQLFFWIMFYGLILIFIDMLKNFKSKYRIWLILSYIFFIVALIFSRYSSTALFNGENFISKAFYALGTLQFFGFFIFLVIRSKQDDLLREDLLSIRFNYLFLFSWLFFMLISARGAIRLFFVVTPAFVIAASYGIIKSFEKVKEQKDELAKYLLLFLSIAILIAALVSASSFYKASKLQASYTGPSANLQWQKTMQWVRENTENGSIFVHWWDYGYWVQYLGERPSVTDGGHAVGYWDHLIGRYLLTTPKPETALSFMKSHNVSYLLIDPSDIGKYSAYSKIGSDETGMDRYSYIPTFILDERLTEEKRNSTTYYFVGGTFFDEDFVWQDIVFSAFTNGVGIAGFKFTIENGKLKQPIAIAVYKGQRYEIPIRYLYYNKKLYDFLNGYEGTLYIIPYITLSEVKNMHAALWLSPKVTKSFFARVYLFNETFNNSVVLAYQQDNELVAQLKASGTYLSNDIVLFRGNLLGPIRIYKINYPSNILAREEFTKVKKQWQWAELDDLQVTS